MKTCANCRCVYADDYNGKCQDCGAEMGGQTGSNQGQLGFGFARQIQAGQRESAQERAMARGDYSGVKIQESLLDVARGYVVVDEEKLAKLEAQVNAP